MNIPLTVGILTYNEADNIKRCLQSVAWAGEIIIVDNSTDATLEIAQSIIDSKILRVFKEKESNDFSKLRNLILEKAKNEWVLFLDADEVVSKELRGEMDSCLRRNDKSIQGFFIKRQDYFLGKWLKHGETGNIKLLKLGRKSAGRWTRQVHEVWNIGGEVETLSNTLQHYPHPTIAEFMQRINRWTTLDAQVFYKRGVRSSFWKIFVYPIAKFKINYFLRLGFLDGMPGLIMAICMSFHSFLTRAKLYLLLSSRATSRDLS